MEMIHSDAHVLRQELTQTLTAAAKSRGLNSQTLITLLFAGVFLGATEAWAIVLIDLPNVTAGGGLPVSGNATQACSRLVAYLESGFGTLVASAAGLGAIVAASVGGFKAAWSLLVVSIGCFILRSYLYLFLSGC